MPGFAHPVHRAFAGDGQAVKLAGEADREVANVDHLLHFAQPFGNGLAAIERHQFAQRLFVVAQGIAQAADELPPHGGGNGAPLVEGGVGTSGSSGDVGGGGV